MTATGLLIFFVCTLIGHALEDVVPSWILIILALGSGVGAMLAIIGVYKFIWMVMP